MIVDLSHPGLVPADVMAQLQPLLPPGTRTLAFGPHVYKERLQAATAAGFEKVISRGEFHTRLAAILRSAADTP